MSAPSDRLARVRYQITHWGLGGEDGVMKLRAADPTFGTLTALGELVAVTYRTSKGGDPKNTDYEHLFGKRGKGLPILAFGDGGLVILGGDYRVTARGIVG